MPGLEDLILLKFTDLVQPLSKFKLSSLEEKVKGLKMPKTILKKIKFGGFTHPDFKNY